MSDQSPSPEKPTEEWVTGDEPMTGPQASYLETLAREAGEAVPQGLTKAQASELIDRLQGASNRLQEQPDSVTPGDGGDERQLPLDETGPTEFGDAPED
ncbi:MAG: DUF3072 domain-containing protein [Acidimicrobiia bacterium]|nr:DUF3072 domain-containing protein [Acidimicrobiia bacterium]